MSLTKRALLCLFLIIVGNLIVGPSQAKEANRTGSLVEGNARFQVLTPNLVRMEYSPGGKFIDEASVAVLKRDWPAVPIPDAAGRRLGRNRDRQDDGTLSAPVGTVHGGESPGALAGRTGRARLETRRQGRQESGRRARGYRSARRSRQRDRTAQP